MTIKDLKEGQSATICTVGGDGALRQHFLDMGVIPGIEVKLIKYAPMGDPLEIRIHDYELTLRLADAEQIEVSDKKSDEDEHRKDNKKDKTLVEHPGLGEGGKYHVKADEHPLPKDEILTFALVGNQNCGKTTLFNQLTGSNQHVGNFPGVTVDRKEGMIKGYPDTRVTDLPGVYSLSPYSSEEIVTRQFVFDEKPKGIINIVDATNIERNLYLTMQLMELDIPMVLALNMMDEVRENGGSIRINQLESMLGIPVIPYAQEIKVDGDSVIVKRQYDDGYHMLKAKMPCLVTALSELNEPRYMTPGGIFDAVNAEITTLGRADLVDVDDSNLGLKGSPTKIAKASDKVRKGAGEKVVPDSPDEAVSYIVGKLKDKHVI